MFPVQLLYIDKIRLLATTFCNHGLLSSKLYQMKMEMTAALHVIAWHSALVGRCRVYFWRRLKSTSHLLMQQLIRELQITHGGSACDPPWATVIKHNKIQVYCIRSYLDLTPVPGIHSREVSVQVHCPSTIYIFMHWLIIKYRSNLCCKNPTLLLSTWVRMLVTGLSKHPLLLSCHSP